MANTAYVITDGSLDPTSKIGGVAGKIVVDGCKEVIDFGLPIVNAGDSTIVEYLAIAEAIKKLGELRFKVDSPYQFENVVFATDSLSLMCAVDPDQVREKFPEAKGFIAGDGKKYANLAKGLHDLTQGIGVEFKMAKVKAHVGELEATSLESIHNEVDILAKEQKDLLIDKVKKQSLNKAENIYSVLIPKSLSAEGYDKIKKVATILLNQGIAARVLIEKGAKNPVTDAYNDFVSEHDLSDKEKRFLTPRNYEANGENPDSKNMLKGLNRTRARMWLKAEDELVDEWVLNGHTGRVMGDVIASTLGNSHSGKVLAESKFEGSVSAKPVSFLLHHGEEGKMPDHDAMLTRAVKTFVIERKLVDVILSKNFALDSELSM